MNGPRQRKNVENLSTQEVQDLRNAFQGLQTSNDAAQNYAHFVNIHEASSEHGNELFLPWHRAFIFEFENALRQVVEGVTLPYWDWIATPAIPEIFAEAQAGSGPNPLYCSDRYTKAQRAQRPYPTAARVAGVMSETAFFTFGGGYDDWTRMGDLEFIHGDIHNWVGATMEVLPTSPNDPVFWIHHAQVDRLWADWEAKNPGANPHDPSEALSGLDSPYTVADVHDIKSPNLNYEYVENSAVIATGSRNEPLRDRFRSQPSKPAPKHFNQAELRFKGLHAVGPVPAYLDVSLNGKQAGKLPLFALHPHPHRMRGMRHGITMTVDVTKQVKRLARNVPLSITIKLTHPVHPRSDFRVGFDQIVLAFPS